MVKPAGVDGDVKEGGIGGGRLDVGQRCLGLYAGVSTEGENDDKGDEAAATVVMLAEDRNQEVIEIGEGSESE